ncbi:CSC1-like protein ERD4 [Selaginella moellendorffii]|nr:CSC1-like protein ERD4 [Selaginella moellendorffii]|eukprot:XP_002990725.2 CSC1-like protein ERD4 [Selaginella moellendorffii]
MDTTAFITSLVTSLLIFLFLSLLYVLLARRPKNYPVYYPAVLIREEEGKGNPEVARLRTPFQWLSEAWRVTESEIVSFAGLDAAIYIHLLDAALKILSIAALFCLPVLVTVAALSDDYARKARPSTGGSTTATNSTDATFSGLDKLAMGNIPERNSKIWLFAIGAYWLSAAVYIVLWTKYRRISKLRKSVLSSGARPEQFAALVRDIPRSHRDTAQIDAFFRRIHPDSYERCIPVGDLGGASKTWKAMESTKAKLDRAQAGVTSSNRPHHKTGTLGLLGPSVDSVDFYKEKLREASERHKSSKTAAAAAPPGRAAILVFNNPAAAAACGQCVYSASSAGRWVTSPAPEPRQMIWGNVKIPWYQRYIRQAIVYTLVALTILFFMIPIGFVSAFSTLDKLEKLVPFVKNIEKIKVLSTVLQAYLPQLALIVFLALLPTLLLFLSRMEGIVSQSHVERAAAGKYFYFNVFNVFLGITITSSLFDTVKKIQKEPNSTVSLLGAAIPPAASFFITFIALRFFVGYGLQLSRLVPLIIFRIKKKYLCKTKEDIRAAWAPKDFSYATRVPGDMLILTIALCYAVIAPMVLPFALVYFAFAWIIARHEALKVVVPAYESYGRMWPHIHTRIIAALLVSQLAMLGYFSIKKFVFSPILVPLPIATLLFALITNKIYYPTFKNPPLEVTGLTKEHIPTVSSIVTAYTPSYLDEEHERDKFEDARSAVTSAGITAPV